MNKKDRRDYQRIRVDAASQFLIQSTAGMPKDFEGIIENISEEGIGIKIADSRYYPILEELAIGEEFYFQAIDEYYLYSEMQMDVFQAKAKVIRIEKRDDAYYIGGKIISNHLDFQEYVERRKVASFIDGLQARN